MASASSAPTIAVTALATAATLSATATRRLRAERRMALFSFGGTNRPEDLRVQADPGFMQETTAQMGHWWEADEFIAEVAARIGGQPNVHEVRAAAKKAAERMGMLAGRSFGTSELRSSSIDAGGLPFVPVDDLQIASFSPNGSAWPVPDLANPSLASVLQLSAPVSVAPTAIGEAEALRAAGSFVAELHRLERFSHAFVLHRLRPLFQPGMEQKERLEFFQRLADPTSLVHMPIGAAYAGGWWMQVTRRLVVVRSKTPDDQLLVEPLLDGLPLVAVEPTLILARTTRHPVERAILVRIWPLGSSRATDRSWRVVASAIHRYGRPILTVDDASTPEEIGCQLVLLAYWHGYLEKDDPALADVLSAAYPGPVGRIRQALSCPDTTSAAALLLEQLLHPGFDPLRGAHSTRKYISRKARIVILDQRKAEHHGAQPWDELGVSERFYYKLLHRFGRRLGRYWDVDDATRARIAAYLDSSEKRREVRGAAMDVLEERGFTHAAARKWLQRHPWEPAVNARPRRARPTPSEAHDIRVAAPGPRVNGRFREGGDIARS